MSIDLTPLFKPRSVAVIGASRSRTKVGNTIVGNLIESGFKGKIYPINPHARAVRSLPAYGTVGAVRGPIDLAIIAVPAPIVAAALRDCGQKKIRFVIVISAGFKEAGDEGRRRDQDLRRVAKRYRIHVLGPNCLGVINANHHLNASFAAGSPRPGRVALVSQSGAMLVSLVDWSLQSSLGIGKLVSLGNQSGITETDVLEYLGRDPETDVIGLYMEQLSDTSRFMSVVSKLTRTKPVIVLKVGGSEASRSAISSHTGSMTSPAAAVGAMLTQIGAIGVRTIEDLFHTLHLFSHKKANPSRELVIVTNAGGPAISAVDALVETQLTLTRLPEKLKQELRAHLPPSASVANPVDLVGDADFERFRNVLSRLTRSESVANLLIMATPQTTTPIKELAEYIVSLQRRSTAQIVVSFIGGKRVSVAKKIFDEQGVTHFDYPHDALKALSLSKLFFEPHTVYHPGKRVAVGAGANVASMPYARTQRLLLREGFPLLPGAILKRPAQLRSVQRYPVVMKALSKRIIHKAAAGAVILDIDDLREAEASWRQLMKRFRGVRLEGMLVQEVKSGGAELILGMKRDPLIGPVIMLGLGGSMTEVIDDTALRIAPFGREDAEAMIRTLAHQEVLRTIDHHFIISLILKLSELTQKFSNIAELDLNPVKVYRKGGAILDARIFTYR